MIFRKMTLPDLDAVMQIIKEAKAFLKKCKVPQWQVSHYPDRETFISDIKAGNAFVVTEHDVVIAVCAAICDIDISYLNLPDGQWLTSDDAPYVVIHRCAVSDACRGQNVIGFLFDAVAEMAAKKGRISVRIDTHEKNEAMKRALQKSGFTRCGRFLLVEGEEAGAPRIGYERMN